MYTTWSDSSLMDEAVAALERHGFDVNLRTDAINDATLELSYRGKSARAHAQVRHNVNSALIGRVATTKRKGDVLIVPHMTEKLGALSRSLGVEYVDAAGNMSLEMGSGFVEVSGKKKVQTFEKGEARSLGRNAVRAFQPSGLKVVFALLCDRHVANAPYRDIAKLSNSSLGTVQWVMAELIHDGYVEAAGRQRTLHRSGELLDRWTEAYTSTLYPKLWLGRFDPSGHDDWVRGSVDIGEVKAWWGGETAASKMGVKLRPASSTLYVDELPSPLIGRYRLKRNDSRGLVTFRQRFWGDDLVSADSVPLLLVHADMVASGDSRQVEAAAAIRKRLNDDA